MSKRAMQWQFAVVASLAIGLAAAAWAAEHPTGAEHPNAMPAAQQPAAPAQSAAPSGGASWTGEVVDLSCYMAEGARGKEHKKCAKACLVGGSPAGLLQADGSVVLLVENHKKKDAYQFLRRFAGDQVKVTGTSFDKGGIKAVAVDSVEKSK